MTDYDMQESADRARAIFGGLAPSRRPVSYEERLAKSANPTVPIILVGSMAMSLVGTATVAVPRTEHKPDASTGGDPVLASTSSAARVAALPAPATYTVVKGDTVSGIAGRYGLSTASVLSRNGLSTTSIIYPGQVLRLTSATASTPVAPTPIASAPSAGTPSSYVIVKGDTVGRIAARFGVTTQEVLSANGLGWASIIYPGQKLTIPSTSTVLPAVPVSTVTPAPSAPAPAPAPAAPAPAPAAPAPAAVNGSYVIQSGDNMSKIASKFGVSLQALLDANGLTRTSIIYTGRTLVVPGVATTTTTAGVTSGIKLLADDQEKSARTIIAVGRELGVPDYGIIIALATAMQESSLRNLSYGHLDSVGLYQQRPSAGWGTVEKLTDPAHAARLFYGGPSNPNKGVTRGLLDITGWQAMTLTQAAQKVQVSAYPTAYAKWEASARVWFDDLR